MAVSLKHNFVSTVPNDANSKTVGSLEWNEEHNLTMSSGKILGRSSSGTGSVEELDPMDVLAEGSGTVGVANRTGLKALSTSSITRAYLFEGSRSGLFEFKSGDYSTQVALDTQEGIYIAADDTASTSGAWVRVGVNNQYNVLWFGAAGDGATDDSTAVQCAVNVMTTGGVLYFPFATYVLDTSIEIAVSDVKIVGNGSTIDATSMTFGTSSFGENAVFRFVSGGTLYSTTLASSASAGATSLSLTSGTGAAEGQFIRCISTQEQYQNSGTYAYYNDQNKIVGVSGSTITLESPLKYGLSTSGETVTVSFKTMLSNISVEGFTMLGGGERTNPLGNGFGLCGVFGNYVQNMHVKNCRFYGFQGISVILDRFLDCHVEDCYFEGHDASTTITEGNNSGFYGAYGFRGRRFLVTRCIGQRVRHLCDGAEVYSYIQSDNIAYNTWRGAFGSHEEVYDLTITGNTSYNCVSAVVMRALTGTISNNIFTSGASTYPNYGSAPQTGISFANMSSADPERAKYNIIGNKLHILSSTTPAIRLTLATDHIHIANNTLSGAWPGVGFDNATAIAASYENVSIIANSFVCTEGTANVSAICTTSVNDEFPSKFKNVIISQNIARDYTSNFVQINGSADVTDPADYIKITDNLGTGANTAGNGFILRNNGYYGENIVIRGNSHWGDSSAAVSVCSGQQYRLYGYPIVELNDEFTKTLRGHRTVVASTSSSPTELNNATLLRGSVIEDYSPAAGAPSKWFVSANGTNGTIAGVTGDITTGTNILTLTGNDATKVYAGSYVTVAGAGITRVRVNSISSDFVTATLASNATSTVSGAAVSRGNPSIVATANLV